MGLTPLAGLVVTQDADLFACETTRILVIFTWSSLPKVFLCGLVIGHCFENACAFPCIRNHTWAYEVDPRYFPPYFCDKVTDTWWYIGKIIEQFEGN